MANSDSLYIRTDLLAEKDFAWNKTGLFLIHGKKGFSLSHLVFSQLLKEGYFIYIIDCAIRFDVFQISSINDEMEELLSNIIIQRAFTPYQILDSTQHIEKQKYPHCIYFYLAPFKQFFDGDVKQEEGQFLLKKLILRFSSLKNLGLPLVIVEKEKYSSPIFPEAMANLRSIASTELDLIRKNPILPETDLFNFN